MKKDLTEMVFILDKSGSMADFVADTIGGFNAMIEKQKKEPGEALVSAVLFSDDSRVLYDRVDIKEIGRMTEKEYSVGGSTALIDAMGDAIHHIGNVHKYIRDEDRPEHTVFVINTDGYENASHRYTSDEVKQMIERQKEKYGWEFIFVGANIDAVETAKHYGIDALHTVEYVQDKAGMALNFEAQCMAVSSVRSAGRLKDASWKEKVEKDRKSRAKR